MCGTGKIEGLMARPLVSSGASIREAKTAGGQEGDAVATIVKPVDLKTLSDKTRLMLREKGRLKVTRNTLCPCGSAKRFKRCCMSR